MPTVLEIRRREMKNSSRESSGYHELKTQYHKLSERLISNVYLSSGSTEKVILLQRLLYFFIIYLTINDN